MIRVVFLKVLGTVCILFVVALFRPVEAHLHGGKDGEEETHAVIAGDDEQYENSSSYISTAPSSAPSLFAVNDGSSNTRGGLYHHSNLGIASTHGSDGYAKPIALILVTGVLLAIFGSYWHMRNNREEQPQEVFITLERPSKSKRIRKEEPAAAPLMSIECNSSEKSSPQSSSRNKNRLFSLVDSTTATGTNTTSTGAPTSGTYHFTYYKNGKPFQSTSQLRFEPANDDNRVDGSSTTSWKISGHGVDDDGAFSILDGSVCAATGSARWVEKSKDRLVLNTGTFNFESNKFTGGWKMSRSRSRHCGSGGGGGRGKSRSAAGCSPTAADYSGGDFHLLTRQGSQTDHQNGSGTSEYGC